jgi:SAM-dependent methyltransferase
MDHAAAKATQHTTWQTVAPGWKKWSATLTKQSAAVTARITASLRPGQRVLDLASGVGDPAITIAKKVAPGGSVLGTDLVEEMLAVARENAAAAGVTNVEFRCADAEHLDLPPASFDAATMRFGMMFLPDAAACATGVRAALKPGGSFTAVVWQSMQHNVWGAIPIGVLKRHMDVPAAPPDAPGLWAMSDREKFESVFRRAGFETVVVEPFVFEMADFDRGEDYLQYMLDLAGPIRALYATLPAAVRAKVDREIVNDVMTAGGGRARLPGAVWIAAATKR